MQYSDLQFLKNNNPFDMKKIIFVLLFVVASLSLMAQEQYDTSAVLVSRIGNNYIANDALMNKKEFMDFLRLRDAISYSTFRSAYNLSNVGWGLFAGGLAVSVIVFPLMVTGVVGASAAGNTTGVFNSTMAGYTLMVIGDLTTIAGIACLGVGYARMHQTCDTYNALQGHRRKQSGVALTIQSSNKGLGLALKF